MNPAAIVYPRVHKANEVFALLSHVFRGADWAIVPTVATSASNPLGGSVASPIWHWQTQVVRKASGGMISITIEIDCFEKLTLL
jgi:hypothetical protein